MSSTVIQLFNRCKAFPKSHLPRVWSSIGKAHYLSDDACIYYLVKRINDQHILGFEIHEKHQVIMKDFNKSDEPLAHYIDFSKWVPLCGTIRAVEIVDGAPTRVLLEFISADSYHDIKQHV